MPVRNTLTRLRLSPHKVRGVRGAAERCAEPARFASTTVGRERVHHGPLGGWKFRSTLQARSTGWRGTLSTSIRLPRAATPPPAVEEVSSSWQRSANKYGVDPVDSRAPRILTPGELKNFREPLDKLIFSAQEEIDQLYRVVREAGYAVLFCDSSGVAVEHRGEDAQASRFEYWGTWLGGVWSEEVEGTNGIGTCIVEERPVTVHRSQHFRSRHIDLSCSGAPVFGVDGRLMAVLDVSAIDPELSESSARADWRPYSKIGARHRRAIFSRAVPSRVDRRGSAARGRRSRHAAGD